MKPRKSRRAGQYRWSKWASVTPGGSSFRITRRATLHRNGRAIELPRDDAAPMIAQSGWHYRVQTVPIVPYMVVFRCSLHRACSAIVSFCRISRCGSSDTERPPVVGGSNEPCPARRLPLRVQWARCSHALAIGRNDTLALYRAHLRAHRVRPAQAADAAEPPRGRPIATPPADPASRRGSAPIPQGTRRRRSTTLSPMSTPSRTQSLR